MNSIRFAGIAALSLLATGLAACTAPAPSLPPPEAAQPTSGYQIGAGDTLSVFVYRAPELSAPNLPVRPDGRISLPLVPDMQAAGRTPTELARAIEGQLREYVREPNVTVMVQSFVGQPSRQIRVIGEATQPLAIPYREGLSVLDVMINARGLTRFAAGNRAEIVRRPPGGGDAQVIPVRLDDLLRGGDISQDVAMQPGDTLVIPQGWF
ncbi:XrtA/PEP-CTERM system exopolysaccharide export protein [Falsiroseomonas sp. HC035]|uniref:XrtA/PEP-CTERM system exopolysaccharide export protein n=1 Tax=Falsiroseomonas sp. HC035 TaxID=3390999 RepID=UPI003D323C53